jgi:hypothetical protein
MLHLSELSDQLDVTLESSKPGSTNGSRVTHLDLKQCNQIKIMPFIQTSLAQSKSV